MPDFEQDSAGYGMIARVRKIARNRVYFQIPNGSTGWVDVRDLDDIAENQVVIVFNDRIEPAPEELWHEEPAISVVRIKNDDRTVLEYAGQIRSVPTNEVPYNKGNTVEFLSAGVIRVLDDMPLALVDLPDITESAIDAFKVPPTSGSRPTFEDFGGMPHVVKRARKLIETPLNHKAQLTAIGAPQARGVLFVGEPGTGKSMLARIIASESGAMLYQINGPEIVSKWVGQSEELLRKIFASAQKDVAAIIFFDEIDSIAEERRDETHEASRRLVAQFLTLMDNCFIDINANVIVIGTTNRVHAIEPALRRPGRFDWEIQFLLPDVDGREHILKASSRRLAVAPNLPHRAIAELTESWTPADLSGIWKEAALLAVTEDRSRISAEDYFGGYQWISSLKTRVEGQV